jgi:cell division septum initiation protein DivIVA
MAKQNTYRITFWNEASNEMVQTLGTGDETPSDTNVEVTILGQAHADMATSSDQDMGGVVDKSVRQQDVDNSVRQQHIETATGNTTSTYNVQGNLFVGAPAPAVTTTQHVPCCLRNGETWCEGLYVPGNPVAGVPPRVELDEESVHRQLSRACVEFVQDRDIRQRFFPEADRLLSEKVFKEREAASQVTRDVWKNTGNELIEDVEAANATLTQDNAGLESEKRELQEQVIGLQSSNEGLQSTILDLQASNTRLQDNLQDGVDDGDVIGILQSELGKAKSTISQLNAEKGRLQHALDQQQEMRQQEREDAKEQLEKAQRAPVVLPPRATIQPPGTGRMDPCKRTINDLSDGQEAVPLVTSEGTLDPQACPLGCNNLATNMCFNCTYTMCSPCLTTIMTVPTKDLPGVYNDEGVIVQVPSRECPQCNVKYTDDNFAYKVPDGYNLSALPRLTDHTWQNNAATANDDSSSDDGNDDDDGDKDPMGNFGN